MKSVVLIGFLLHVTGSFCQSRIKLKEKNFDPSSFDLFEIKIKKPKKDVINVFSYNTPIFIDKRADTTKFGFAFVGTNLRYHRMVFPEPAAKYLTNRSIELGEYNKAAPDRIVFVQKD